MAAIKIEIKKNDVKESAVPFWDYVLWAVKKYWHFYLLLFLPITYFIIFRYGPMYGNIIAFRRFILGGPVYGTQWVGLRYFKMFLDNPEFWKVFKNTFLLSTLNLAIGFPIPIIFALLLNEIKNGLFKRAVQTISYLPHFISVVVLVGLVMEILSPTNGIINNILKSMGVEPIYFLNEPQWFRFIYISSGIWQGMGWSSIIYLATLSGIDTNLYEAAEVDGANRWQQTIFITIPSLMNTAIILLILNIGHLLDVGFEKVLLLYNPSIYDTADVISTYVFRMGLQNNNYSYATAVGLFENLIGLVLIFTANKLAQKYSESSLW